VAHGIAMQLTAFMFMFHIGMTEVSNDPRQPPIWARDEVELASWRLRFTAYR
jgi:MATE family multidrug resistance protein